MTPKANQVPPLEQILASNEHWPKSEIVNPLHDVKKGMRNLFVNWSDIGNDPINPVRTSNQVEAMREGATIIPIEAGNFISDLQPGEGLLKIVRDTRILLPREIFDDEDSQNAERHMYEDWLDTSSTGFSVLANAMVASELYAGGQARAIVDDKKKNDSIALVSRSVAYSPDTVYAKGKRWSLLAGLDSAMLSKHPDDMRAHPIPNTRVGEKYKYNKRKVLSEIVEVTLYQPSKEAKDAFQELTIKEQERRHKELLTNTHLTQCS